ncbi:MAG: T9SS type A sorting domain-containing protein [Bacteroidetes bacterium]|nr:T9SS type A sorting domain-containing protein [Bacteroidota bacterium]
MKQILLITIAALLSCYGFSQNRAINWAFGDSAGLNFSTEPPLPFSTSIKTFEPSATISNEDGNLLFYTNGKTIWNAEHEPMLNGNFLDNGSGTLSSTTQGVIILPYPRDTNKYYVFHLDFNFLKYTVVDMSYEDGLGLVTSKNNIISEIPAITEKMHAVLHGNGRDWWLVVEALPEGGIFGLPFNFYEYLITPDGINEPVIREGAIFEDQDAIEQIGQMKFNQQGTMIACTNGRSVILYNFDRCSGFLSAYYSIDSIFEGSDGDAVYGLEFSPNGNVLYVSKAGQGSIVRIYQYDLLAENIKESQFIIYTYPGTGGVGSGGVTAGSFQLALNNRIYITTSITGPMANDSVDQNLNLTVINYPNLLGEECSLDPTSIWLGGKKATVSLPNMPNYNLGVMEKSGCDTIGTTAINTFINNAIQLYPNPAHNHIYLKQAPQGIVQIHIADIYGKEVLYFNQYSTDVINISTLPSGLYFITITQENAMLITQKLVVER